MRHSYPLLYQSKENCCGCTACYSICPVGAIDMKPDDEGFLFPTVDRDKCIRCGKCLSVCNFAADQKKTVILDVKDRVEVTNTQQYTPTTYALKLLNDQKRFCSQSGGAFQAFSDAILNEGGTVYGCIVSDEKKIVHARAENVEQRDRMLGSKYVQSDMGDIFAQIKADLVKGKKVLFSGVACQVAGLRGFLQKDYPNLYCVDIICHGVPSPRIWNDYISWRENKYGKCQYVNFRDKRFGWRSSIEVSEYLRNNKKKQITSKVFGNLFYGAYALRLCCHKCPYKTEVPPGDITIGDYWGIEETVANWMEDPLGVSMIMINTQKGQFLFEMIRGDVCCRETQYNKNAQHNLSHCTAKSERRDAFWSDYRKRDFEWIAVVYGHYGLHGKIINRLKRVLPLKKK